jgi:hypothetical protein
VIDSQYFIFSSADKSAATEIPKPISVEYITNIQYLWCDSNP